MLLRASKFHFILIIFLLFVTLLMSYSCTLLKIFFKISSCKRMYSESGSKMTWCIWLNLLFRDFNGSKFWVWWTFSCSIDCFPVLECLGAYKLNHPTVYESNKHFHVIFRVSSRFFLSLDRFKSKNFSRAL